MSKKTASRSAVIPSVWSFAAVAYRGHAFMETEHVLRFAPTAEGFDDAVTQLRAILDARRFHGRHRHDIEIVFDEVATNIVHHGRPSGAVEAAIRSTGRRS